MISLKRGERRRIINVLAKRSLIMALDPDIWCWDKTFFISTR